MTLAIVSDDTLLNDAVVEHRAFVRARLRRLGVAAANLDDAAQDVFEILARRVHDYDPARGTPRAYLSGIARRVAVTYRRRAADTEFDESLNEHAGSDPEIVTARAEAWTVLERFLEGLDQDRWTVFVLSEIEGMSGPEIAEELSVNVNTVYARLRSARRDLARALGRERARQRGPLGWFFGAFAMPRRTAVAACTVGAIALTLVASVGMRGCASAEQEPDEPAPTAEPVLVGSPPPGPKEVTELVLAAAPTQEDTDEDWTAFGSGSRTTKDVWIRRKGRYRIDGDLLILETDYTANSEIEAFGMHLELEGLEVVDGTEAWSVDLEPEVTQQMRVVLRATEVGRVRVLLETGFGRPEVDDDDIIGGASLALDFDGEALTRCTQGCSKAAEIADADPSGTMVDAQIRNDCDEPIELTLFTGAKDVVPPADAQRISVSPGHTIDVRFDANTRLYKLSKRSRLTATLNDGELATFSGTECTMVRTGPITPAEER
jgi:RNA polymerase sigma-70 factor (ECF subfamily)